MSQVEAPEILPCPFCGNHDLLLTDQLSEDGEWNVFCHDCGGGSGWKRERNNAVMAWNTRADTLSQPNQQAVVIAVPWIQEAARKARPLAQRIRHRMMQGYIVWTEDELTALLETEIAAIISKHLNLSRGEQK
jgi:Lar family restriction alleviation protein